MTWSSPIPPAQLSWKKSPTRRQASFTRNPWLQRPGGKNRKSLRDRYVRYNLLPSTLAAGSQTVPNRRFSPILLLLEEKPVGPRGSRCHEKPSSSSAIPAWQLLPAFPVSQFSHSGSGSRRLARGSQLPCANHFPLVGRSLDHSHLGSLCRYLRHLPAPWLVARAGGGDD